MGHFIEVGHFQSVRSRAGIKWSKTLQHQLKVTNINSNRQNTHTQTAQSQQVSKQVTAEDIFTRVKITIEDAISSANRDLSGEPLEKRNK